MGLIEKQIRKRGNQKLAEPLSTPTRLQPREVAEAISRVCERHNQAEVERNATRKDAGGKLRRFMAEAEAGNLPRRKYYFKMREKDLLVSYEQPVDEVLARLARGKKQRTGFTDGYWLANVRVMRGESGENRVEVRLTNWIINQDGKLGNKDKYQQLTDMIWEAVSAEAGHDAPAQPHALF